MTLDQKIDEAQFFLEHIAFYDPDISVVKYFFSAFLYSVSSIPDYILAEASTEYKLDLLMDDTWYPADFERESKKQDKLGKPNALIFFKWWKAWTNSKNNSAVGKIFKNIRNMETHKIKQKPIFNVMVLADKPLVGDVPIKIPVEVTGHGDISSVDDIDISINLIKPKLLEQINKQRKERSQPNATDIQTAAYLQMDGLPNFGSLVDSCGIWLQMMTDFARIAREIMTESRVGRPKTGI